MELLKKGDIVYVANSHNIFRVCKITKVAHVKNLAKTINYHLKTVDKMVKMEFIINSINTNGKFIFGRTIYTNKEILATRIKNEIKHLKESIKAENKKLDKLLKHEAQNKSKSKAKK